MDELVWLINIYEDMGPKWICILVIMWVSIHAGCCHGCWEQDRLALLQLKPSFYKLNWLAGEETSDCCKWKRVECSPSTGRVIKLSLNGSRGLDLPELYINASLFLPFEELKELDLESNNIAGCIENQGFEILSSRLSNLKMLELGYNNFDNNIISSLRDLSSLEVLYLDYNQLKGTIHSHEFYGLNNLEELHMSGNKIEGFKFGSLQGQRTLNKLKVLDLGSQQINTSIQLQLLGSFPNLRTLDLRNNSLNGTTTNQELGNLTAVEELFLDESHLRTDFLQSIGPLTSLKILSLRDCGLKGILPNQVWCELKNLQVLDLTSNELEGTLPPCLGNLSSLQNMYLSSNQFNGNIASTPISNLISLELLWLGGNYFEVPMSLKPLANLSKLKDFRADNIVLDLDSQLWTPRFQLQSLFMGSSHFKKSKPHLPNFLYYQNDLRSIDLFNCDFGGVFPTWLLENNSLLAYIGLRGNYFTEPLLWPSHSNLHLSGIDISENQLQGQIPTNVSASFPNLQSLRMSNNYFKGTIPSEFCKLHLLGFLDLSKNDLSGFIPPCFNRLQYISYVHLNNNRLRGQLPHDFLNKSSILVTDLSYNSFSGIIPNWIGNFSRLGVLLLRGNHFHGEIPIGLCNLNQVSFLDLSSNNLSGRLPPCLSDLNFEAREDTNLVHYFTSERAEAVEFMTKSRSLNYSGMVLNYMFGIDLSSNKFSGEIPPEFGNLYNVKSLNLSHNNLTGPIPTTFANLKQIESLDLSNNHLIGLVPPQLTELNSLAVFRVAHNNLSGPVPDRKGQFITFDESSYEGNPFLCGPPLTKSCRETASALPSPNVFLGEDEKDGLIDSSAFYVTFVVSYVMVLLGTATVLYINPYWRQAWFYRIEVCITACYYFMEDNFWNV